jgi:hypothetical protein
MVKPATTRRAVWLYNIELVQLDDGTIHVSLTAITVDDEEPQLPCREIASKHVTSIDDALAVIKEGLTGSA